MIFGAVFVSSGGGWVMIGSGVVLAVIVAVADRWWTRRKRERLVRRAERA